MLHRVAIALAAITLADGQAPVSCTFKTPTGSSVRCAHARASFFLPFVPRAVVKAAAPP